MQRPCILTYVGQDNPLQHYSRKYPHQQRCTKLWVHLPFLWTDLDTSQGDWKLGGLGLTIPLKRPDGSPTSWEFPTFDSRMSPYTQRSFDYIGAYTFQPGVNSISRKLALQPRNMHSMKF